MAIDYPANRGEVISRIKTDTQNSLGGGIDPFLRNSMLYALCVGFGGASYDNYLTIQQLQKELFVDTSDGYLLGLHAKWRGIFRMPQTGSSGYVSFTGIGGVDIPAGTEIISSDGLAYKTLIDGVISSRSIAILNLSRSSSTVIAITNGDHNIATNDSVLISGADQAEYNGSHSVIVINSTIFQYTIDGIPATPATTSTTITAAYDNVALQVQSDSLGTGTVKDNGTTMYLSAQIAGVNGVATVCANGLMGGADEENVEHWRSRILSAYQNPIAHFSKDDAAGAIL